MLVSDNIESCPSITPEFENQLLDMIRNDFPEMEIKIIDTDPQLMMPRYIFVRYGQTDFITIYRSY